LSAQLSLLNCAFTGALTRLASPLAPATVDRPELLVADGDGLALAVPLADDEGDGVADALACAAVRCETGWPSPSPRFRWPPRCPVAPFLADELADADAVGDALALADAPDDGVADDDALGDGVGGASSVAVCCPCSVPAGHLAEQQLGSSRPGSRPSACGPGTAR